MLNKIKKYAIIFVFGLFIFMYFFGKNLYQYKLTEKKNLTEEMIEKFEQDVKAGVEIDINEYVVKDKDYSNKLTRINTSVSHIIEKGFKKIFEYFIKKVNI